MNIKEAFPTLEASDAIRAQVGNKAAALYGRHQQKIRTRRTIAGGLATAGLIVGGVLVGPSAYALYRLNQISGSLNDCKTMIREDFVLDEKGREIPDGRTVYADGKWRIERKGRTQVFEDGVLWSYDSRLNQVLKFSKPAGPFGYNASGASVKSMLRDMTTWNWSSKPSVGTAVVNGQKMTTVTLDEERDRMVLYADIKTDMPVFYEAYRKENGVLKLFGISRQRFNVPVDAKEFAKNFPATAPLIDIEKIKTDWAAKVEKPIASLKFAKGEIQIRDYAVNERGHVFVVYTNGENSADRGNYEKAVRSGDYTVTEGGMKVNVSASDSLGNQYIVSTSSFQPYMGGYGGKTSEWIVLKDGQVMQGAWLYTADVQPWRPRKIDVEISNGNQKNVWTIDLKQPTTKLVAEWFRSLAIAPAGPDELLQEENRGRRMLYSQQGNNKDLIPLLHEEIARLKEFGKEHRRRISLTDLYFSLYRAHRDLGEKPESLRFLRLADQEPDSKGSTSGEPMVNRQIIDQAIQKEGLR